MAYSVGHCIKNCHATGQLEDWTHYTLTLDVVTAVACAVLGALLLSGALYFSPNTLWINFTAEIAWIGIAFAAVIAAVDTATLLIHFLRTQPAPTDKISSKVTLQQKPATLIGDAHHTPTQQCRLASPEKDPRELIISTPQLTLTTLEIDQASAVSHHQILGELYLGNCTTLLTLSEATHNMPNIPFTTVVTVCPISDLLHAQPVLTPSGPMIGLRLQIANVSWHYVGKSVHDDPEFWPILVHDCTFPKSPLTIQGGVDTPLHKEKSQIIENTPVREWFEPIFLELDAAVCGDKKALVHCFAGRSRSATLISAYLIRRFRVSTQEAVAFLQSKRACVEPKFIEHLEIYAQDLTS